MTLRTGVLVSNVPFRMNSARSNDRVSSAKPGPRKNGQNNSRRGGDRRTASALSQRPKTMKAAHAPVPSMVVAGEQPILVAIERNRSMSPAAANSAQAPGEIGSPTKPQEHPGRIKSVQ